MVEVPTVIEPALLFVGSKYEINELESAMVVQEMIAPYITYIRRRHITNEGGLRRYGLFG